MLKTACCIIYITNRHNSKWLVILNEMHSLMKRMKNDYSKDKKQTSDQLQTNQASGIDLKIKECGYVHYL